MTAHQQVVAIEDLLARADSLGYCVICLPGVGTEILPPVSRGDDRLIAEIMGRLDEVEMVTLRSMPRGNEARAWRQMRRDQRARSED